MPVPIEHLEHLSERQRAVFHAACDGDDGALEALATNNAGAGTSLRNLVNARAVGLWTPLHIAANMGHAAAIRALGALAADPDATNDAGETALHWAAYWGHCGAIAALLALGADADPRDAHGWTPLHLAAHHGTLAAVRCLVRLGADPDIESSVGRRAVDYANEWNREDTDHQLIAAVLERAHARRAEAAAARAAKAKANAKTARKAPSRGAKKSVSL